MILEDSEIKFADILPDAVLAINNEGDLLWGNTAAETLFTIHSDQLVHHNVQQLIFFGDFNDFINKGLYFSLESHLQIDKDTFILIKMIYQDATKRLLLVRDISHLHYLEKMRQDFVANVSHELRTPLTVIHGYLELLLSEDQVETRVFQKMLTQMYQQGLRMEKLVEDLLLLSRLESQPLSKSTKVVMVSRLLKSICQDAKIVSKDRDHIFNLQVDENLRLLGNESELYAAFSNIILNAVHYTPAKGVIHVTWEAKNDEAILTVCDTGIGIRLEDIPRITERFYRVDKARSRESGGTGLGLAIVKHVLIRHEARLEIESKIGCGSSFRCIFPLFK